MPKISSKKEAENISLALGGVASVDKALTILKLFSSESPELTLIQIANATGLYKSTILRLLASLENSLMIVKQSNTKYILGPAIAVLYTACLHQQSLEKIVVTTLEKLTAETNESAAFHIRQGDQRLCLYRVDSTQALRDHVKVGDLLPIDKGAGGRVLVAFDGGNDRLSKKIRQDMVLAISGDRDKEISGISAPVFNPTGLIGVITLTMPTYRFNEGLKDIVKSCAKRLSEVLGGRFESKIIH